MDNLIACKIAHEKTLNSRDCDDAILTPCVPGRVSFVVVVGGYCEIGVVDVFQALSVAALLVVLLKVYSGLNVELPVGKARV